MRAIDGDKIVNDLELMAKFQPEHIQSCVLGVCATIRMAKTLDMMPVKHGYWIGLEYDGYADGFPVYDLWECSECGNEHKGEDVPNYCSNCGGKMDKGG